MDSSTKDTVSAVTIALKGKQDPLSAKKTPRPSPISGLPPPEEYQFQIGNPGGPGRPLGSKNADTLAKEAIGTFTRAMDDHKRARGAQRQMTAGHALIAASQVCKILGMYAAEKVQVTVDVYRQLADTVFAALLAETNDEDLTRRCMKRIGEMIR